MHGQYFYRALVALAEVRRGVLADYRMVPEARAGIDRYLQFYNYERPHQSLAYRPPADLYHTRVEVCGHDTEVNSEGGRCCYWGRCPQPPGI